MTFRDERKTQTGGVTVRDLCRSESSSGTLGARDDSPVRDVRARRHDATFVICISRSSGHADLAHMRRHVRTYVQWLVVSVCAHMSARRRY